MNHKKITQAVFLTGAAARISQEVALLDTLIAKKGLVLSQENTLLAGFSSGSLNIAAINMAFCQDSPISWDKDYREGTLYTLENDDVFIKGKDGKISIFDTRPLRKTLDKFLALKNISAFGDLPFQSFVLTYPLLIDHQTQWARNFGPKNNSYLSASDLFMASTAIPILFPSQRIKRAARRGRRNFPIRKFVDGGTQGTFYGFEEEMSRFVAKNGTLDDMYIISPMRKEEEDVNDLIGEGNGFFVDAFDETIKDALSHLLANISFHGFMKFLKALKKYQGVHKDQLIANNIYVSIPFLEENTGILDFGAEKTAYDEVIKWTENNDYCMPLDSFIERYDE